MSKYLPQVTIMSLSEKSLSDELKPSSIVDDSNLYNLQDEIKLQEKYEYMFNHISYLFSPRFDYIIEGLKLSMTYELQYKKALCWYQEMNYQMLQDSSKRKIFISEKVYMINKFIQKWALEHPNDIIANETLYKELVLSDFAMNRITSSSPKLIHLENMKIMESIKFHPYIHITKEEFLEDKKYNPDMFIKYFESY
jgi:hypothetical protein